MGLSIPQYFNEYTAINGYGPVHTRARWVSNPFPILLHLYDYGKGLKYSLYYTKYHKFILHCTSGSLIPLLLANCLAFAVFHDGAPV